MLVFDPDEPLADRPEEEPDDDDSFDFDDSFDDSFDDEDDLDDSFDFDEDSDVFGFAESPDESPGADVDCSDFAAESDSVEPLAAGLRLSLR